MSYTIVCDGFWIDKGKGQVVSYPTGTDQQDAAVSARGNDDLIR